MLIRFKDAQIVNETDMICGCEVDYPAEFLKVVKEVDYLKLQKEDWKYCWSEFKPTTNDASIDVVDIYVDPVFE